jgi:hypothetical protein
VQGCVCRVVCAGLCVQGCVCRIVCAGSCVQDCVCRIACLIVRCFPFSRRYVFALRQVPWGLFKELCHIADAMPHLHNKKRRKSGKLRVPTDLLVAASLRHLGKGHDFSDTLSGVGPIMRPLCVCGPIVRPLCVWADRATSVCVDRSCVCCVCVWCGVDRSCVCCVCGVDRSCDRSVCGPIVRVTVSYFVWTDRACDCLVLCCAAAAGHKCQQGRVAAVSPRLHGGAW